MIEANAAVSSSSSSSSGSAARESISRQSSNDIDTASRRVQATELTAGAKVRRLDKGLRHE